MDLPLGIATPRMQGHLTRLKGGTGARIKSATLSRQNKRAATPELKWQGSFSASGPLLVGTAEIWLLCGAPESQILTFRELKS